MNLEDIKKFLEEIVRRNISEEAFKTLQELIFQLSSAQSERCFYLAFGKIPRITGKAKLAITEQELVDLDKLYEGLSIKDWTVDRASRVLLIMSMPVENPDSYQKTIKNVFDAGDVNELVALYSSLPLMVYPESFADQASEGVRSNITEVYDAVALDNPFPASYLSENAWNQLVLKAVFNNRPLYRIYDLDKRANAALAHMLSDFVHERWAAGRKITPELWRCVGSFIDTDILKDIEQLFLSDDTLEQEAAALACAASNFEGARHLLEKRKDLARKVAEGVITWQTIADRLHN